MSIQKTSIQETQTNKCPHGLPVGTCPICNGMMGSKRSKDKDKPRIPGEMTYNECMAAWLKIQAMKEAKLKAQIEKMNAIKEANSLNRKETKLEILKKSLENYVEKLNEIHKNFENSPKIIQVALKAVTMVIKPILKVVIFVLATVNFIVNTISNVSRFIMQIAEKLPSMVKEIFDDIKKMINDGKEKFKKVLNTILSLFCENKEEEKEDSKKRNKLKELFKKVRNYK